MIPRTGKEYEAARRLASRGFDMGAALQHAAEPEIDYGPCVLAMTQEEKFEHWHEKEYGIKPMIGLSDVDYSDIKAEFDDLTRASSMMSYQGYNEVNLGPDGGFGIVKFREREGALVAQVTRAETRFYDLTRPRKQLSRYGEGRIGKGFVDALNSVIRDVDVYDPHNEIDLYLKFMLIRADFVGGQCHFCKSNDSYILNVRHEIGYGYLYKCRQCRRHFTAKSGSLLHGTKFDMPRLMDCIRMSLDTTGLSSIYIAKRLNISQAVAWNLRRLMRNNSVIGDRWRYEHDGEAPPQHRAKPVKFHDLAQLEIGLKTTRIAQRVSGPEGLVPRDDRSENRANSEPIGTRPDRREGDATKTL